MLIARAGSPASIATAAALPSNAIRRRFVELERSSPPQCNRVNYDDGARVRDHTRIRGLSDRAPDTVHVAKSGSFGRRALSIPVVICSQRFEDD